MSTDIIAAYSFDLFHVFTWWYKWCDCDWFWLNTRQAFHAWVRKVHEHQVNCMSLLHWRTEVPMGLATYTSVIPDTMDSTRLFIGRNRRAHRSLNAAQRSSVAYWINYVAYWLCYALRAQYVTWMFRVIETYDDTRYAAYSIRCV